MRNSYIWLNREGVAKLCLNRQFAKLPICVPYICFVIFICNTTYNYVDYYPPQVLLISVSWKLNRVVSLVDSLSVVTLFFLIYKVIITEIQVPICKKNGLYSYIKITFIYIHFRNHPKFVVVAEIKLVLSNAAHFYYPKE